MTKKEASMIKKWLKTATELRGELVQTDSPDEMELRLSKKLTSGKVEYVIIGIPFFEFEESAQEEMN